MPNFNYTEDRHQLEIKHILVDVLSEYSRPLCISLFQKVALAEILSEL